MFNLKSKLLPLVKEEDETVIAGELSVTSGAAAP